VLHVCGKTALFTPCSPQCVTGFLAAYGARTVTSNGLRTSLMLFAGNGRPGTMTGTAAIPPRHDPGDRLHMASRPGLVTDEKGCE
jgi:hypothetical protein